MIRRVLLLVAVSVTSLTSLVAFAPTAHADNGYIACVYEHDPLHQGLCIGMPQLP